MLRRNAFGARIKQGAMRMRSAAMTAAGCLLAATPAFAQAGGPATDGFAGLYVAGVAGQDVPADRASRLRLDRDLDARFGHLAASPVGAPRLCGHAARCVDAPGGPGYAGRVGFDMQAGRLVLGAVGEAGRSAATDRTARRFARTMPRNVTETGTRARIGYTPDDRTLLYATGGAGRARFDRDGRMDRDDRRSVWGLQGGGGIERRLSEHLSLGLEYLQRRYAGELSRFGAAPIGAAARETRRFRWQTVRATAAFRF
jgi:outer membrane immunogenic protein